MDFPTVLTYKWSSREFANAAIHWRLDDRFDSFRCHFHLHRSKQMTSWRKPSCVGKNETTRTLQRNARENGRSQPAVRVCRDCLSSGAYHHNYEKLGNPSAIAVVTTLTQRSYSKHVLKHVCASHQIIGLYMETKVSTCLMSLCAREPFDKRWTILTFLVFTSYFSSQFLKFQFQELKLLCLRSSAGYARWSAVLQVPRSASVVTLLNFLDRGRTPSALSDPRMNDQRTQSRRTEDAFRIKLVW